MVIRRSSVLPFLFGAIFISPIYFLVGFFQVFILQLLFVSFVALAYLGSYRSIVMSRLDWLVLLYVLWNLFSFVINVAINLYVGDLYALNAQSFSMVTSLLLMIPYLFGRFYFRSENSVDYFIKAIALTFPVILIYFLIMLLSGDQGLYANRGYIGQRIPMMIAFIGWALMFVCLARDGKKWLILLWMMSSVVVVLSLTRASYLQWVVSFLAFVLIWFYIGRFKTKLLIITGTMFFLIAGMITLWGGVILEPDILSGTSFDRVFQYQSYGDLLEKDESTAVRYQIWLQLIERVTENPVSIIVGFGQLGPGYVGESFVSLHGNLISNYAAHNQYLDTLVRAGVVGMFFELLIFTVIIIIPLRRNFRKMPNSSFFLGSSAGLLGVLAYGFFHEAMRWQMFGFYFWLYAGIVSSRSPYIPRKA